MGERLKKIRELLSMNQSDFAKELGLGQSTLAMMEVGKREILDRHIKTICSVFNINEDWLRNGKGDIFIESNASIVAELVKEYKLSSFEEETIRIFIELPSDVRKEVNKYIASFLDTASCGQKKKTGLINKATKDELTATKEKDNPVKREPAGKYREPTLGGLTEEEYIALARQRYADAKKGVASSMTSENSATA